MIVRFADEAERDLEEIGDHIAIDDPGAALRFVRVLRDRCLALAEFPNRFPMVERYVAAGLRRCLHVNYLIFYRVEEDAVVIVHVLHGAQDYPEILGN
jgi:plasmid stabilization system protein ParE